MSDECRDCQLAQIHGIRGIFSLKCKGCKLRLLLDEPCKVIREILAQGMTKWGELPEYKIKPNCGCKFACERRQSMQVLNSNNKYKN
jgi:hypothetical protein